MALARIVHSTIADYIRKEQSNVMRKRVLLAMLEKRGRISYNRSGLNLNWKVEFDRQPLQPYTEGGLISFAGSDRYRTFTSDWVQYVLSDSITKKQTLMNRGAEAIIKLASDIGKKLLNDGRDKLSEELYIDGAASANANRLDGLLTPFQIGNGADALSGAATNGDDTQYSKYVVALQASSNYGGVSMNLGGVAGDWESLNWPLGRGDESFDFNHPLAINIETGEWTGSTTVSSTAGLAKALRFGYFASARNGEKQDFALLSWGLLRKFLESQESKQRTQTLKGNDSDLTKLGFEAVSYDGVELTWEYGMPSSSLTGGTESEIGFGINLNSFEICSMQDKLFASDKDSEITVKSDLFLVDFYGATKNDPRKQVLYVGNGDS